MLFFVALSIAATRPVFKMVLKAGGKKAGQRGREHVENKQGHIGTFPLSKDVLCGGGKCMYCR